MVPPTGEHNRTLVMDANPIIHVPKLVVWYAIPPAPSGLVASHDIKFVAASQLQQLSHHNDMNSVL